MVNDNKKASSSTTTGFENLIYNESKDTIKKPVPKISVDDFTNETTTEEVSENSLDWKAFLIEEEPEEQLPLIEIGKAPVSTPGNHLLIIGKKKSRKTLFLVWYISQYKGRLTDILWCDTEQGKRHVWKIRQKVYQLTGQYISILSLRGLSPLERRDVIKDAETNLSPKILIIDGIRDLLSNINDADQCTDLVTWVEALTTSGLHIVNVLHMNKTDSNARGHIGSELLNKAEMTIELELDEKANCTLVKCESSRDIPFDSFAFTHDENGLPEMVSVPTKGKAFTDEEKKELLQYVFEDNLLKYNELIDGIKTHFKVGKTAAEHLHGDFSRLGWYVKSGKDRSPDAVYKLMAKTKARAL